MLPEIIKKMAGSESEKRMLTKLGYYDYQQGLIFRHLNQKNGWDSHLEKCRNFILKAVEYYKPEKVTVMGSGWLLDLPLTELLDSVKSVTLIDIVHPPAVVSQVSELKDVRLLEADVTGGLIERVWEKARTINLFSKMKTIMDIDIPEYRFDEDPGVLISLNILSQLHVLPVRYLKTKSSAGNDEYAWLIRSIQQSHLDLLGKYDSVVITDTAEVFTWRSGAVTEEKSVFVRIPDGKYREEWTWDFDLRGNDFNEKRSVMKVTAVNL